MSSEFDYFTLKYEDSFQPCIDRRYIALTQINISWSICISFHLCLDNWTLLNNRSFVPLWLISCTAKSYPSTYECLSLCVCMCARSIANVQGRVYTTAVHQLDFLNFFFKSVWAKKTIITKCLVPFISVPFLCCVQNTLNQNTACKRSRLNSVSSVSRCDGECGYTFMNVWRELLFIQVNSFINTAVSL